MIIVNRPADDLAGFEHAIDIKLRSRAVVGAGDVIELARRERVGRGNVGFYGRQFADGELETVGV